MHNMWMTRMNVNPFYPATKIIALIGFGILLMTMGADAQNNTSSPYSYYGLGELMKNGNSISMGETNLTFRGKAILNTDNPAALAHIDSLKFIFNMGVSAKYTNLRQGRKKDFVNDYNVTRFAFGFKVAPRYATAFSISPYSSLGYDITKREKVNGSDNYFVRSLKGSGGLNQFVWSNGVQITDNLSVGFNGIYIFGNNTKNEVINVEGGSTYVYQNNSQLISQGLHFNVGAQYDISMRHYLFTIGAKYQPKIAVNAKQKTEVTNLSSGFGTTRYKDEDRGSFDVPMSYAFGLGMTKNKQLWFGADYLHEKWSETKIFKESNDLVDRNRFSLGMNYIADDGYATKFLKKLTYSAGAFYDTGYIRIEGERITTRGVSFGIGIPMAQQKGMINLSFEFGQMGTTKNNNVREDFGRVTVELSLFERWFSKRKYQ